MLRERSFSTLPGVRRLLLLLCLSLGAACARPVAIAGVLTSPRIETKTLPSGREGLPVWFLPQLGVQILNTPGDLRLSYGGVSLRFTPKGGWNGAGLPAPELLNGSVHVSLSVLRALGVPLLEDAPQVLDFAARPLVLTPPAPDTPLPAEPPTSQPPAIQPPAVQPPAVQPAVPALPLAPAPLTTIRSSRALNRATETQRVVLEFGAQAPYSLKRDADGLSLTVGGATSAPSLQKLESGDVLSVSPDSDNLYVRLTTGKGGVSQVFTLADPYRIVIDTVTNLDPSVTPPPDLAHLPPGVTYRQFGGLELLSFDPAAYAPKLVSAGTARASSVYDLVRRAGGVAGVNGGYFDPKTSVPVDLVALGGLMVAPSLERRATLGFLNGGVLLGYPRPRYTLLGPWGSLTVNTVRPQPNPLWLTLFVGDGATQVGAAGYTTLTLDGTSVTRAVSGPNVPLPGEIALTFAPARFPQLPQVAGTSLTLGLNWAAPGWDGVQEALAAGPLLVEGGQYALDPAREGFNTGASIWRATRQVAFAVYAGQPTIAYFRNGTPEEFARALLAVGVARAMRLDSGSSATVYVSGGYLNTVWSRAVPNAIVFVPREVVGNR